jgi:3D (Asp-Asp-Asp) domain-containing protein
MHNPNGITNGTGYPYAFDASVPGLFFDAATSTRTGEDVVLTNVIAFDIRVFDPAAPVSVSGDAAAVPGDTAFSSGLSASRGS